MYGYEYGGLDAAQAGLGAATFGLGAMAAGLWIFIILIALAVCVFQVIVTWKMFEKAGKPGWAAIIPIYSTYVLFQIIGYKWYYIFFLLLGGVPIIGGVALLAFTVHYNIKLAKAFGKEIGFGIGLALIPIVFIAIIAFDKDIKYIGPTVKGDIDFNDLF